MQVLLYTSPRNVDRAGLLNALSATDKDLQITHISTIGGLIRFLGQPRGKRPLCILAPGDCLDLAILVDLRHLMRDMRVLLVLPKNGAQSFPDVHLLRPRFVSQENNTFSRLCMVVRRLAGTARAEPFYAVG